MGGAHMRSCKLLWPVLLSMLELHNAGQSSCNDPGLPTGWHWASLAAADNKAGLTHDAHCRVLLHFFIDGLSEGFPHQLLFLLCHCHYIELPPALPWPCRGSSGLLAQALAGCAARCGSQQVTWQLSLMLIMPVL